MVGLAGGALTGEAFTIVASSNLAFAMRTMSAFVRGRFAPMKSRW